MEKPNEARPSQDTTPLLTWKARTKGWEDWLGADVRFCRFCLCCCGRLSNYDNGLLDPWRSHTQPEILPQTESTWFNWKLHFHSREDVFIGFKNWINIYISNNLSPISSLRLVCYENMQRRLPFQQLSGFFYKQRFLHFQRRRRRSYFCFVFVKWRKRRYWSSKESVFGWLQELWMLSTVQQQ